MKKGDSLKESIFKITKKESKTEVSIYKRVACSSVDFAKQALRINNAFPDIEPQFFEILEDMVQEESISHERLKDSVNSVIKTHVWNSPPRVAAFLSFDRTIELLDHQQLININDEYNQKAFKYFKKLKLPFMDKIMYIKESELLKFPFLRKYLI